MRRVFFLLGVLYMMRAFTMYATVMPVASRTYYCSPKSNHTGAAVITLRAIRILVGKLLLNFNSTHDSICLTVCLVAWHFVLTKRNGIIDQWSTRLLRWLHLQWTHRDSNRVVAAYSRIYPEEMAAVTLALVASHLSGRCLCYGRSRTLHCGCPHCVLRHYSSFLDVSHHGLQYHLEGWWNVAKIPEKEMCVTPVFFLVTAKWTVQLFFEVMVVLHLLLFWA